MSFPTLTEVYDQTRAECGDTEVPGGQIYTNSLLLPHIQSATRTLWRGLRNLAVPRVQRIFYYTLPANTSIFYPSTAGITDFSEPCGPIGQRTGLVAVGVSNCIPSTSPVYVAVSTSTAHGLSDGDQVVLEQIGGVAGVNVCCAVTVDSSNLFRAQGVIGTGTYTSGGYVVTSRNDFHALPYVQVIADSRQQSTNGLQCVLYQEGRFQFVASTENTQLKVQYFSSATVPTTGSDIIGFNDCLDFLAKYAGSMACKAQGANDRAATLKEESVGPRFTDGIFGGELRQLMQAAVRERQNLHPYERSPRPFREQGYGLGYPL